MEAEAKGAWPAAATAAGKTAATAVIERLLLQLQSLASCDSPPFSSDSQSVYLISIPISISIPIPIPGYIRFPAKENCKWKKRRN